MRYRADALFETAVNNRHREKNDFAEIEKRGDLPTDDWKDVLENSFLARCTRKEFLPL
ncbi:MAG: hypothetical protein NXH85_12490 [Pseudomonadaceae bacterium]|nr:hypothetical protein [Pseudomonadaceae bacterium]